MRPSNRAFYEMERLCHKEIFRNRWKGILPHFGLSLKLLKGKHGPCPFCGGKDRFRFSNYRGLGDWICNQCGAGDGIEFVKRVLEVDFKEAVRRIEPIAAKVKIEKSMTQSLREADSRRKLNSIWKAAEVPSRGCPVWMYLERRLGPVRAISDQLRYHPRLAYIHENGTSTFHPAMVALITDADDKACNLHRTYLMPDGRKADLPQPKKTCAGSLPKGCAIRLAPLESSLGIAEGIETSLAAAVLTGTPCWAAINCHGLETWEVPEGVNRVTIFGDNDKHYVGQAAAYSLASRLAREAHNSRVVEVIYPHFYGDWCDVLNGLRNAT